MGAPRLQRQSVEIQNSEESLRTQTKSLNPTTAANAVAVVVFVLAGAIVWQECIPMTTGAVIGGWIGAHIGRRLPSPLVRVLTFAVAVLTTTVFFSRAYL
ncbi:putative membrane protein YfcA [Rhizobium sp. BK619]|nr:putative membrane protein YfcA [Rhizobium sp. BK619]